MDVRKMQRKLSLKATQNKDHRFADLYSLRCSDPWLETAYDHIKTTRGSHTAGIDRVTRANFEQDSNSLERLKINLTQKRFRPTPVRRVYLQEVKESGRIKIRPLGIPTWSDKLLQEVSRSLLEAYYEPQFSDRSHGFRPNRGCHTALRDVMQHGRATKWFIEGDLSACCDRLDHAVLEAILQERFHDNRFLRLRRG